MLVPVMALLAMSWPPGEEPMGLYEDVEVNFVSYLALVFCFFLHLFLERYLIRHSMVTGVG